MAGTEKRVVLPGSETTPSRVAESDALGPVDPAQKLSITVTLRPKPGSLSDAEIEAISLKPPAERDYLARDADGADPADVSKVAAFASRHRLNVTEADLSKRRVVLEGTAADLSEAFGVTLTRFAHPDGEYRRATSSIHVPVSLAPAIESVLGLDDQPAAQPRG